MHTSKTILLLFFLLSFSLHYVYILTSTPGNKKWENGKKLNKGKRRIKRRKKGKIRKKGKKEVKKGKIREDREK